MSATKNTKATTHKRVLRKATFTKEVRKNTPVYVAVNKRAHKWARKQGKRSVLTASELKAVIATKKVAVYLYSPKGTLVKARA